MLFVNPLLLAGASFVALPIVLHLIMRQRPRHVEFPAMRFLQRRMEANRRRLQLRHWLLLMLRMAAIALLAFALARPSVKFSAGAFGSQEAPIAAALVFDAAPRMEYRQDNQTRIEAAQKIALSLLAELPPESQIAVLDTRLGPAAFQADRGSAKDRIERLEAVPNSQPLPRAIEEAVRLLATSDLDRKEIYVFTDLTQGAWPAAAASQMRLRLANARDLNVYLVDVGVEKPVGFSLGDLRLSSQVLSTRSTLQLDTSLASFGHAGERTIELFVVDREGRPQKRNEETVKLDAGQSQHLEFRIGGLEPGTHQGFVRIAGQDALGADDTRFFTVEVKRPWRILLAAPRPAEAYAVYLAQALAPSSFRKQKQARFDCETVSLEQLADLALDPYAAVFVLDPGPLAPATWRKLANFASDGRGLALFLGRNAKPIEAFNEATAQEILPGALVQQARDPDGQLHLAPRDYSHPILEPMRTVAGSVPWADFPVFRYWQFDKLAQGTGIVIPFSNGQPALIERPIGSGRALVMATPVSDRPNRDPWNLLPIGEAWPFVILANQMAGYLVGSVDEQFTYFAGQTAVLALGRQDPRTPYVVSTPRGDKIQQSPNAEKGILAITATDEPGNYQVESGGTTGGVRRGFSVNLAAEQTSLTRLPAEELKPFFGDFEFRLARSTDQLDRAMSSARVGRELFGLLIFLVAGVMAFEHVAANRFYRDE